MARGTVGQPNTAATSNGNGAIATSEASLNELGEKIFLDRYALKDMTKRSLAVGDTIIVCVDQKTRQREIGSVLGLSDGRVKVELRDGTITEQNIEDVDKPLETQPAQMMTRVARGIAAIETTSETQAAWEANFRWLLDDWKFVPGGRILSAAGTDQQLTFFNCYVVPSPKDSRRGIVDTLSQMMEIMSRGGGVGINLSSLRPRHAYVKGVNGRSSGAVSWGGLYSFVTGLIEQGGSRRGALMLILNVWHPDVLNFINSKREMGKITNANISIGLTDSFMEAVQADGDWQLVFADPETPGYDEEWDGDIEKWRAQGKPINVYKTVKAREIWNNIVESAWASAEPGLWFVDRTNKMSNSWYFSPLVCTNPCVTGDTLVATEHGYTRARDLRVGMKIRTPSGLRPIEKVYNNGTQRIYRIEFSDGGHLECTADHKLKVVRDKKYEWVATNDLRVGDKVLVAANESYGPRYTLPPEAAAYVRKRDLNVADYYDRRLGLVSGVVIGDGVLRKVRARNSHSYQCQVAFGSQEEAWQEQFVALMNEMNIHTHHTLAEKEIPVGDGTLVVHASVRIQCYKLATLLAKIGLTTNLKAPHKAIPEPFMGMEKEFLAGLLDGLFSTDGSVLIKQDNPMLRFHTSSYKLAQQVRLLLLQFGIHGRVYRGTRDEELEYDGRSMYGTGEKYDVIIMNEGIPRFYSEIGLSHPEKAERLKEIAENWHYIGGTWTASVVSVQDTEREEEVFDVYEPNTLTWVTNGYVSFDCGEQPLPAWGICNLGAINLGRFTRDGEVLWDDLRQAVRYAVRFLDNVIDATPYFFDENYRQQQDERRVGLGIMGLADMLIKVGIRYGSDECIKFLDQLGEVLATEAYRASAENAAEKGSFPMFDAEKLLQSGYMQAMPDQVREAVRSKGLRNVTLLTVAPTGTTGTMVGTSTGVEPYYSWSYFRKSRLGVHEERVAVVEEWEHDNPGKPLPPYFVNAMQLSPIEHVNVQAAIQRWIDSAISKTCNVPSEYTVEQTRELYEYMYRLGCKGGTIYRDGSRDEQVLNLKKEDETPKANGHVASVVEETKPEADTGKNALSKLWNQPKVRPRPRLTRGTTIKKQSPLGSLYVTINNDDEGEPLEVFITAGKAGSDVTSMADALGRLASLVLRVASPVEPHERLEEIISQLKGIGGARSTGFGKDRVRSLPDAVAQALEECCTPPDGQPVEVETANGHVQVQLALPSVRADLCPQCGEAAFVHEEGCMHCNACGYSQC